MAKIEQCACGALHWIAHKCPRAKPEITLDNALELLRICKDLSKADFADLLGVSIGRYGEILSGKRQMSLRVTRKAFALGIPADVLLWRGAP